MKKDYYEEAKNCESIRILDNFQLKQKSFNLTANSTLEAGENVDVLSEEEIANRLTTANSQSEVDGFMWAAIVVSILTVSWDVIFSRIS